MRMFACFWDWILTLPWSTVAYIRYLVFRDLLGEALQLDSRITQEGLLPVSVWTSFFPLFSLCQCDSTVGHSQLPNRYPEVPLLNTELPFLLVLVAHRWNWFPQEATTCCEILRPWAVSQFRRLLFIIRLLFAELLCESSLQQRFPQPPRLLMLPIAPCRMMATMLSHMGFFWRYHSFLLPLRNC